MTEPVEVCVAGMRWQVAAEYRDLLLDAHGLRLEEWLRAGQASFVKQGTHRVVYRVVLPELDFHVKHARVSGTRGWLRGWVRESKARREYELARSAAGRGVPPLVPQAVGESATHAFAGLLVLQ